MYMRLYCWYFLQIKQSSARDHAFVHSNPLDTAEVVANFLLPLREVCIPMLFSLYFPFFSHFSVKLGLDVRKISFDVFFFKGGIIYHHDDCRGPVLGAKVFIVAHHEATRHEMVSPCEYSPKAGFVCFQFRSHQPHLFLYL
jgi:hypothetical protein